LIGGIQELGLGRGGGHLTIEQTVLAIHTTPCLIQTTSQGYTFRFLGGAPGWQQEGLAPTTETEVTVSPDGRSITNVRYNGSPR